MKNKWGPSEDACFPRNNVSSHIAMPATLIPRGRIHVSPAADQQLARRGTVPGGDGGPPKRAWRAHWRTFKVNSHLEATDKITRQELHESEIDLLSGLAGETETAVSRVDGVWFCLPDDKEGKLRMREERKKCRPGLHITWYLCGCEFAETFWYETAERKWMRWLWQGLDVMTGMRSMFCVFANCVH